MLHHVDTPSSRRCIASFLLRVFYFFHFCKNKGSKYGRQLTIANTFRHMIHRPEEEEEEEEEEERKIAAERKDSKDGRGNNASAAVSSDKGDKEKEEGGDEERNEDKEIVVGGGGAMTRAPVPAGPSGDREGDVTGIASGIGIVHDDDDDNDDDDDDTSSSCYPLLGTPSSCSPIPRGGGGMSCKVRAERADEVDDNRNGTETIDEG